MKLAYVQLRLPKQKLGQNETGMCTAAIAEAKTQKSTCKRWVQAMGAEISPARAE
jgi:hypothetical protein